MRFRLLVGLAGLLFLFVGKACTYTADPGGWCEGSILEDVECPEGYTCDDMNNWTCTPDDDVAPPAQPTDSTDAGAPTSTILQPHADSGAVSGDSDAAAGADVLDAG